MHRLIVNSRLIEKLLAVPGVVDLYDSTGRIEGFLSRVDPAFLP
jgi:hypothetical protein